MLWAVVEPCFCFTMCLWENDLMLLGKWEEQQACQLRLL
jgi:hypothetical protein